MTIQQAIEKGYYPQIIPIDENYWILRIKLLSDTRSHFEGYQEEFISYDEALEFGLMTINELWMSN